MDWSASVLACSEREARKPYIAIATSASEDACAPVEGAPVSLAPAGGTDIRNKPMLNDSENIESLDHELTFIGFELSDCVIKLDSTSAKYLRAVHRTALELAIPNRFGVEAGGFWLTNDQIAELRRLPDHYPPSEAKVVARTIEIYLRSQLEGFYPAD